MQEYLRSLGRVSEWATGDEEIPGRFVDVFSAGVGLMVEDGVIQAVNLYPVGRDDYAPYTGDLPLGLTPSMTRRDTRRVLGVPQFRREPGEVKFLRRVVAIERYDRAEWSVALEFDASSGRIVLVQLMRPEAVPW